MNSIKMDLNLLALEKANMGEVQYQAYNTSLNQKGRYMDCDGELGYLLRLSGIARFR